MPFYSVVIPLYNEEANTASLYKRIKSVMEKIPQPYEIVFIDDGSTDHTPVLLEKFFNQDSAHVKVITLSENCGQQMALLAGFNQARGTYVLTLDADMQTPPEELPKLIKKIQEGYDYVSSFRLGRQDHWFRGFISKMVNFMMWKTTRIKMKDHGCMLRAYHKEIVENISKTRDPAMLVQVLAYTFSKKFTEIGVLHAPRTNDRSKYTVLRLARATFDLFIGFSATPIRFITLFGIVCLFSSTICLTVSLFHLIKKFDTPAMQFFTFLLCFFIGSFLITAIGIVGEYASRIYHLLKQQPLYKVKQVRDVNVMSALSSTERSKNS